MSATKKPKKELLGQRPERLLSKKFKTVPKIQDKDIKALLHELQVHQVELEMQNEELRRAQADIEDSRTKYSDLYDFAPVGYFTFSQAGETVEVNLTGASLLGIERMKLLHRSFSTFVDPEFRSLFRDHRLSVLKSRGKDRCELKLIKKDGKSFYASLESISIPHGKSFRIRSAISDITHLKQMEKELKHLNTQLEGRVRERTAELEIANRQFGQSDAKFRILADNTYDMEFWVNPEGQYIFVSPSCTKITGHDPNEFMENPGLRRKIVHPEDLPIFDRHRQEEEKEEGVTPREVQFRVIHADSSIRWIGHVCQRVFDEEGRFLGIRASNRDITERKRAEEALRESKERYRSLTTNVPSVLMRYDKNLRILFLSPKAEEITGVPIHQFIGKTNREAGMPKDLCVLWENAIQEVFRKGQSKDLEFDFPSRKGTKTFYLKLAPEFSTDGTVKHVLGISTDITERKQAELLNQSLNDINLVINSTLDFDEIMNQVVVQACKAIGAESAGISLRKGNVWAVSYAYGFPVEIIGAEMVDEQEPHAALAGKTKQAVVINDAFSDERVNREHMRKYNVRSVMVIPLATKEKVIGVLFLNYHSAPVAFTSPQIDFARKIGYSLGLALENSRLFDELRRSRDELEIRVGERTAELMEAVEELQDEISERKRVEEAIQLQADQLATMLATTPDGFWVFDTDGKLLDVNDAYCRMSGYSREELLRLHIADIEARETPEETVQHIRKVKGTGFDRFESQHRTKDGRILDVEISVSFWRPTDRFLLFTRDITERKRAEEALRAAHQYNRSLIEASLDPLVTINADGEVTDVNKATEIITGFSRDRLIGSDFSDYFTEPDKAEKGYLQVFLSGSVKDYPLAIRHTSGKVIDVLYNATLYRNEAGEIQGAFAAARDITEIREAQKRTEATNSLLNLFVRKSTRKEYLDSVIELIQPWSGCRCAGIRVLNEKDYIPYESYVGYNQEFWESENLLSVKYDQCACIRVVTGNPDPQDRPVMTPAGSFRCENTLEFIGSLPEEEQTRFRGTCIKYGFKSVAIVPIRYRDKILGAIHLADESEGKLPMSRIEFIEVMAPLIGEAINRFNLEEELKDSETRLRYLSSQLLTVQENERRSIARELHDGVGQMLTAVKFKIESALQLKSKKKSLEAVIPLIKESIEEVRRVQMDLRPSTLDDLGVLATLGWFCREYQKIYSHIRVEKKTGLEESDVPMPVKTVIYRVTQEALNNIAKHSKANLVRFSLNKKENKIELTIRDDGIGFDLEQTLNQERSRRGLGLTSMRERTQLSGGSFVIETTPGKGTILRAEWPI